MAEPRCTPSVRAGVLGLAADERRLSTRVVGAKEPGARPSATYGPERGKKTNPFGQLEQQRSATQPPLA